MDDEAAVVAANAAFYRALEALDLEAMDRVWLHADWVRCVHPGWEIVVGWDEVRQSWSRIFENTRWMRVTPTTVEVVLLGEIGLVFCSESISTQAGEGVGLAVAQATNLFRRTPAGYRLFHHHASPAPIQVTEPFSGTVQ